MSFKEILKRMFYAFFIILSSTMLALLIFVAALGYDHMDLTWIAAAFGIAAATDLAHLFFYSKKTLSKKQALIRKIIAGVYVLLAVSVFATLFGWINWREWPGISVGIIASIATIYGIIILVDFLAHKKDTDKMNQQITKLFGSDGDNDSDGDNPSNDTNDDNI